MFLGVCVCVGTATYAYETMYVWKLLGHTECLTLYLSALLPWDRISYWTWSYISSLETLAVTPCCVPATVLGFTGACGHSHFYVGARVLKSCPHAWVLTHSGISPASTSMTSKMLFIVYLIVCNSEKFWAHVDTHTSVSVFLYIFYLLLWGLK